MRFTAGAGALIRAMKGEPLIKSAQAGWFLTAGASLGITILALIWLRGTTLTGLLDGVLLGDPTVLILDEPNIGLDPAGIAWLRETMRGWAAQGRTVLVSSHVLSEVALVADRVVIINYGRVLREADTGDLGGSESAVIVRSPDSTMLEELCRTEGWRVERDEADSLTIHGASAEQVGQIAAGAGIVVHELTTEAGTAQLEQMFLELTGSKQEVSS